PTAGSWARWGGGAPARRLAAGGKKRDGGGPPGSAPPTIGPRWPRVVAGRAAPPMTWPIRARPPAGDNRGVGNEQAREPSQATGAAALGAGWSHGHRDVSGGWLRPTVFGAVDGLVTNASLIAGVGGGGVSAHAIVLTGAAALVAGAFSMGTGEYISVTNQNELVHAEA